MRLILGISAVALLPSISAFTTVSSSFTLASRISEARPSSQRNMFDVSMAPDVMNHVEHVSSALITSSSSSILLSETEPWVKPFASVLGPFLSIFSFAMLCRVVISWYPSAKLNELPFSIAVWPTEPLLKLIRGSIPPAFGVDITPIVWLGIFTFLSEILLGQQGLLTMKMKYGI
mmetsp:Transcript_20118/g.24037  ORF Transcript_20118/g.24037 Transcript_20118/m.24037 type:complete len:175 (+) Transcript_20118:88-612(+)